MKVLVVGGGGREHALCVSIAHSPLCEKLYCAPGNAGIADVAECLPIGFLEIDNLLKACRAHEIDFVVVGPDEALAKGLADAVRASGIACFGPSQAAAQIESSKSFMKEICAAAKVPTAAYAVFTDPETAKEHVRKLGAPIVIKADGLTAGKGVTVAKTVEEALLAIDAAMVTRIYGDSGAEIVIEEFMEGEEVSFFALSDGKTAQFFASAQDHKAVFDGDKGPNTGGMGAYSPSPLIDEATEHKIMCEIIEPTLNELRGRGSAFSGILYAGLMMTKAGPKIVEFNARFGDPETQVMLPRLKSDLLSVLYATAKGLLDGITLEWHPYAALTAIMATKGYPGSYQKGSVIRGLEKASKMKDILIFHAGTTRSPTGEITATGGRVLCITALAPTIPEAKHLVYGAIDQIIWPEGFCRRDIGWRAIAKSNAA